MTAHVRVRMTAAEFIPWAMAQPRGRFELSAGEVVPMASERARHNLAKARIFVALQEAVQTAGIDCTVFTDGMTVVIDDMTAREPDAAVQCPPIDPEAVTLDNPVILVEVVSPASERADTSVKLIEYFKLASVRHHLVLDPENGGLIHHERGLDGVIHTRVHEGGELRLDPPGVTVPLACVLRRA